MKTTLIAFLFTITASIAWGQQVKSSTAPTLPSATVAEKTVTFVGTFRSFRGVMQPLSCYCYDGGELTTKGGRTVKVCFENNELQEAMQNNEKMECKRIKVMGVMKEKLYVSDGNSPCPSGSMTYLKVTSFRCLD
ncbi:MAG: hypothetical protein U0176_00755 [Bacteroidia bacterium]